MFSEQPWKSNGLLRTSSLWNIPGSDLNQGVPRAWTDLIVPRILELEVALEAIFPFLFFLQMRKPRTREFKRYGHIHIATNQQTQCCSS